MRIRLIKLNHERYAEEVTQELRGKGAKSKQAGEKYANGKKETQSKWRAKDCT